MNSDIALSAQNGDFVTTSIGQRRPTKRRLDNHWQNMITSSPRQHAEVRRNATLLVFKFPITFQLRSILSLNSSSIETNEAIPESDSQSRVRGLLPNIEIALESIDAQITGRRAGEYHDILLLQERRTRLRRGHEETSTRDCTPQIPPSRDTHRDLPAFKLCCRDSSMLHQQTAVVYRV